MALSTANPADRASSTLGRMPQLMTTMSVSSVVPSRKRRPVTLPPPSEARGDGIEHEAHAHVFELVLEQGAGDRIELLDHQMGCDLDDRNFEAMIEQAARRFQPEQTAADDDGAIAFLA